MNVTSADVVLGYLSADFSYPIDPRCGQALFVLDRQVYPAADGGPAEPQTRRLAAIAGLFVDIPQVAVGSIPDGEATRHSPVRGADVVVSLGIGTDVRRVGPVSPQLPA